MAAIFQFFRRRTAGKAPPTTMSIKHTFEGHQDGIRSFVFLEDNVHIVSGSNDSTMRKWDCETGQLVGEPWKGKGEVHALALSPDGKTNACRRSDGSVHHWDTNGQMKKDIWRGRNNSVLSLSWSPSGSHLASGFDDGTILVRKVESGTVEVGPIKTNQGYVLSVAYSPLGDRIASGGGNNTICIWDSYTGELLVGPINGLGYSNRVQCVVWSPDSSKLYSVSDDFVRVFDSTSGTLLHRFQHDNWLNSIALSPKHNLLACVGDGGTAQLWDTESHQPFHVPFASKEVHDILHVSFSPDGRYLAYGGEDNKITLWTVGDIAEHLVAASSINLQGRTQQIALPNSQSSSSRNVDDTNLLAQSAVNSDQGHNNPYDQFFAPSHFSLPAQSPNPLPRRRLRHIFSVLHLPTDDSMRPTRFTRGVFKRRDLILSTSPLHPSANSDQHQPTLKGKSRAVNRDGERGNVNSSENVAPGTTERGNNNEAVVHRKPSTPGKPSSPAELDSNENRALWKSLFRSRKNDSNNAPAKVTRDSSPEVVDVYGVRYQQGYIAHKRTHKKKSPPTMTGVQTIAAPEGGSSQAGPFTHGNTAHPPILSQGHAGPSSQPFTGHAGQSQQVTGVNCTDNDSCSDSSIQGPFLKFIDKICFPCGHYEHEDT